MSLYPDIQVNQSYQLPVEPPHTLYIEESGNAAGLPVVFLHGGPGSGCESYHRRFFNPQKYRIILFDQRGAGRSTPHADLSNNTTQALVDDMEKIRQLLGVETWLVFGGSWGSTLALVYAQTHPERVHGLILRGIFMCRPKEIHWLYQQGASRIFPDHWQDYVDVIPEAERHDMLGAYYKKLTSDNEAERLQAATAWSLWEGHTATLMGRQNVIEHFADPHVALSLARIECHYFMHNGFLEDEQILKNAARLHAIPGVIIHGRYDMVCPIESAWELHQAWPQAQLKIIQDAGHAASEEGIAQALVAAADAMAELG